MKRYEPHPYQVFGISFMITHPEAGLFLDMGMGKTSIVLTALNDLKYNRFQVNKVLVIAPKKVALTTWNDETEKWAHLKSYRVVRVLGPVRKRVRALNTPADMYVINRENTQWLVDYYGNDWPFDTVVLDESSSFKNHRAKRFKALTWIRSHVRRLYCLTGTPAPNGLLDLWAQVFLMDGGKRLGKTFSQFRERWFDADQRNAQQIFSYKPKPGAEEEIYAAISDICISMRADDYLTLPDMQIIEHPVILEGAAKNAYDTLERDMLLQVDPETEITAQTRAVLGNKLLQLCNGAVYDENRNVIKIHDEKLDVFSEVLDALQGKPAIVFYSYKHDLERITERLKGRGLRVRKLETAQDERDWNAGLIDVLLAHPASCAYGLNLQDGGNHVIWFGLNWSLELFQQANKRLHRQGQKQKVFIHILVVRGGADEDVLAALGDKNDAQERLLNSLKARIDRARSGQVIDSNEAVNTEEISKNLLTEAN